MSKGNRTRTRPHLYISKTYKCPASVKAVRLPPECLDFIAQDIGTLSFSAYIRALIYAEMERKKWHV